MALKAAAMMRSSGSAMRAAGSRMEVEAPSVQSTTLIKTLGTVRSLKLAKLRKKALEEKLEEKRAKCELRRSRIETNKKKMAEDKKMQQLNEMKKVSKLPVKKPSKVGKDEAAPKEAIAPTVEAEAASLLTGTHGAYQSQPSRLPAPRIYVRAEIEKREEARRVRAELEKKRNKEEEERKKQEEKKMEQEKRKEEEKKVQEEKNQLNEMKKRSKDLTNLSKAIKKSGKLAMKKSLGKIEAPSKEEITPSIEAAVKARAVPVMAECDLSGTNGSYQSRPEVEAERRDSYRSRAEVEKELVGTKGGLGFWRKQEEARRARRELLRSEREKKEKKEEEERNKAEEKKLEEGRKLLKEMDQLNEALTSLKKDLRKEIRVARKTVVKKGSKSSQREASALSVVRKGALKSDSGRESEPESPTGVLQERAGFGWSESSSSGASSNSGYESGDDDRVRTSF